MGKNTRKAKSLKFMVMTSLLFGFWLVLGPVQTAHAQTCTYYISPTGNDANAGTATAPWKTLQHAFDTVTAGQTVCLYGGAYPPTVTTGHSQTMASTHSGSAGSPISFTNVSGQVAIIGGSTRINASYVTFTGTPQSTGSCSAATQCGLIFEGNQDFATSAIDVMTQADPHGYVTFDHVEIRKSTYHAGYYQEGCNNSLIGSYIHDNGWAQSGFSEFNGVYWHSPMDYSQNPAAYLACPTGGGGLIANNIVEHNNSCGINLFTTDNSSGSSYPEYVTVTENTVVNNGNYGICLGGDHNIVANNILYNNGDLAPSNQGKIAQGIHHTVDHNLTWDTSSSSRRGWFDAASCNCITNPYNSSDPSFVSSCNLDWHLTSSSPAIGWSNSNYVQALDHDSRTRTNPSDAGSYIH